MSEYFDLGVPVVRREVVLVFASAVVPLVVVVVRLPLSSALLVFPRPVVADRLQFPLAPMVLAFPIAAAWL